MTRYTVADVVGRTLDSGERVGPELESVDHARPLRETLSVMHEQGYSQMGVEREGSLVGVVSYPSIVRTLEIIDEIDVQNETWRDEPTVIAASDVDPVPPETDVSKLFDHLATEDFAVVETGTDEVHILTSYDLLHFLGESMEPFFLIEEIEFALRELFRRTFPDDADERVAEMSARDEIDVTPVDAVEDCSFSHYWKFVEMNWDVFGQCFDGNRAFTTRLIERIGTHRNRLLHFRVEDRRAFDDSLIRFGRDYAMRAYRRV